jgi:hypothetical protein
MNVSSSVRVGVLGFRPWGSNRVRGFRTFDNCDAVLQSGQFIIGPEVAGKLRAALHAPSA